MSVSNATRLVNNNYFPVTFFKGRFGNCIAFSNNKVCVPKNEYWKMRGITATEGDIWSVSIAGENDAKTVYYVKPKKFLGRDESVVLPRATLSIFFEGSRGDIITLINNKISMPCEFDWNKKYPVNGDKWYVKPICLSKSRAVYYLLPLEFHRNVIR